MRTARDRDLPARLRTYLEGVAARGVPVTYQQAAQQLGLQPPHTINRIAEALERLMAEDADAGRPFIAALVISRARRGLPAPGFVDTAQRLGRLRAGPEGAEAWAFHWAQFEAALAHYGRAGAVRDVVSRDCGVRPGATDESAC